MAFLLFLLVNLVLFVRPSELFPELATVPIYNIVIVVTLVVAIPSLLVRLSPASLATQPATVCVLLLLTAIVFSFPLELITWAARTAGLEFLKVVIYYLLLVSTVSDERRLKIFLLFLAAMITSTASLSLLHEHGAIRLDALDAIQQSEIRSDGTQVTFPRLCGTGIFNDPNDFAMILAVGIVVSLYFLGERSWGIARVSWLVPVFICGYAIWLTRSRGGMLALLAAVVVLAHARWGLRRASIAGVMMLPIVVAVFAARGDAMETGTGQQRVQLWSEGLLLLRSHPIFGIGYGAFEEEMGLVAHNSFVHAFVELGLWGGTLFFGANAVAGWTLFRARRDPAVADDVMSLRLVATSLAILVATVVAQASLSRPYTNVPYLAIGLAVACASCIHVSQPFDLPRVNVGFAARLGMASLAFLVAIQIYVRFAVRWS